MSRIPRKLLELSTVPFDCPTCNAICEDNAAACPQFGARLHCVPAGPTADTLGARLARWPLYVVVGLSVLLGSLFGFPMEKRAVQLGTFPPSVIFAVFQGILFFAALIAGAIAATSGKMRGALVAVCVLVPVFFAGVAVAHLLLMS